MTGPQHHPVAACWVALVRDPGGPLVAIGPVADVDEARCAATGLVEGLPDVDWLGVARLLARHDAAVRLRQVRQAGGR